MTPPVDSHPAFYTLDSCVSDFERQTIAMLAVLNSQMTSLVGNGQPGRITKLEERITALEKFQWKIIGGSSALGAIVGIMSSWALHFIGR